MDRNKPTKYSLFIRNLSSKEIRLKKKLEELSKEKITSELAYRICNDKKLFHKIEDFIIQNANEFKFSIQSNTNELWKNGIIDDILDYKEGLFCCDSLYINAIINALGFKWLPTSTKIILSEKNQEL